MIVYINFYISSTPPPPLSPSTLIKIWGGGGNVQGGKHPVGVKPQGAKRLGEEMDLGRNVPEPSPPTKVTLEQKQTFMRSNVLKCSL